ncbi:hypothetical protein E2C01_031429 [Portunus trituberculatus]|uniref:Uncharacterized protein n=1 Tax=Portunus trituberculatus TaxID=210409 RepID=A0A5B7EWT2_PORTR|nr:hypothetical protein [Portunus trituberculatus]
MNAAWRTTRGRRGAVGPRTLCGFQGSEAHGFESCPRSETNNEHKEHLDLVTGARHNFSHQDK